MSGRREEIMMFAPDKCADACQAAHPQKVPPLGREDWVLPPVKKYRASARKFQLSLSKMGTNSFLKTLRHTTRLLEGSVS